jgi:anti-sigma factor RsiW
MSGLVVALGTDPHMAVQQSLPWYLTGRLDEAERGAVEAHLATCAECRAEVETERRWQSLQPAADAPGDVEAGWARMQARLDGAARQPAAPARPPAEATRPPRSRRPRLALPRHGPARPGDRRPPFSRAWAVPALLSVAVAVALVVTLAPGVRQAADYQALAAAPEAASTAVVRFKPDATEAQIRHGLNASGARLVDGPTVTDAYVVRLPRERYAAALEKLRKQPGVALVEALESAAPP